MPLLLGGLHTQLGPASAMLESLETPRGQITVDLHGATLLSWITSDGRERLFVSEKSHRDGVHPIRGGVPLVFPQFGEGLIDGMPLHGFARTSQWHLVDRRGQCLSFGLESNDKTRKLFPHDFRLVYTVTLLADDALSTALTVHNTGASEMRFQALLHTYFRIPDIHKISVSGLKGTEYKDKLTGLSHVSTAETIRFTEENDCIYRNAPSRCSVLLDNEMIVIDRLCTHTTAAGDSANVDADFVVWNPWVAKSKRMADFGDEEYRTIVCIEAGKVAEPMSLTPSDHCQLSQTLTITPRQ